MTSPYLYICKLELEGGIMNFLRRLLLFIWSLLFIKIAAAVGIFAFRQDLADTWLGQLTTVFTSGNYHWLLVGIAAGLLVLGAFSIFVALAHKHEVSQMIIGSSESGQVNISLKAIDSVVKKACAEITVVHDLHTKIKAMRDGVSIFLNLTVPHGTNIPETSASLQAVVKEQVEALTGLRVTEVKVLITNVVDKHANAAVKIG